MPQHLAEFYPDLADPRLEASVAVFHQRFSTNTLPQWRLAHPFRLLAHNGEINTIEGNRQWALARGPILRSPVLPDLSDIMPLVSLHRLGLAEPRQHARGAADGRPGRAARAAAADPAGLAGGRYARRGSARLLRVLLGAHGALGRAGRRGADRWPLRGLHARPQRPAPGALRDHQEPPPDDRLGDRRLGLRARRRGAQGQARARRDRRARSADRHAARDARRRPHAQVAPSLQGVAEEGRALSRVGSDRSAARGRADGSRDARDLSEDVRHHRRGARRDHPRAGRG